MWKKWTERPKFQFKRLKVAFSTLAFEVGGRVDFEDFVDLMTPKLLAETAGMIGVKELKDAFKEVRGAPRSWQCFSDSFPDLANRSLLSQFKSLTLLLLANQFDMDGDGEITTEELRSAMIKLMGEHMTRREIDTIVKEADDNGDGTVDFEGTTRSFGCTL